ncbi:hypothetical protein Tco_0578405, partial [Tanacetum coccineum]
MFLVSRIKVFVGISSSKWSKFYIEAELHFRRIHMEFRRSRHKTVITHNVAYQADDSDAYDSDVMKPTCQSLILMANLSHYGNAVYPETVKCVESFWTEITSDSNIIPYSQYVIESQQAKAQQLEPKLYVGDIIEKTNPIVIPDSQETLMLAEES